MLIQLALLAAPFAQFQAIPPEVANLGIAVTPSLEESAVAARVDAFAIRDTGHRLHLYRPSLEQTVELGFATKLHGWSGTRLVSEVVEQLLGQDVNGDGDQSDRLLQVYDAGDGTFRELELAIDSNPGAVQLLEEFAAVWVSELGMGIDLSGDGALGSRVLVLVDLSDASFVNTGLDLAAGFVAGEDSIAFAQRETALGGDQNGDGDTADFILGRLELASMQVTTYGVAVSASDVIHHGGDLFSALTASFPAQELLVLEPSGVVQDLDREAIQVEGSERFLVFTGPDPTSGDPGSFLYDPETGQVIDLGLWAGQLSVDGERAVITVPEIAAQVDYNGDGELSGEIPHFFRIDTGQLSSLDVESGWLFSATPKLRSSTVALPANELTGNQDFNGDGDLSDILLGWYRTDTKEQFFGPNFTLKLEVDGDLITWLARELPGGDLNGDGDTFDLVLLLLDSRTGRVWNSGLAALPSFDPTSEVFASAGDTVLLRVSEPSQGGQDLNGDGDTSDVVLFSVRVPVAHGLKAQNDGFELSAGGAQDYRLDAGLGQSGDLFWLLGSATGTTPGLPAGGFELPLVLDAYTTATLTHPNGFPFTNYLGFLDEAGSSTAPVFELPAASNPSLAGLVLFHAFVAVDPSGAVTFASNPLSLELE